MWLKYPAWHLTCMSKGQPRALLTTVESRAMQHRSRTDNMLDMNLSEHTSASPESSAAALNSRLGRHFLTCSSAALCVVGVSAPSQSDAAIVYSGIKNLALPTVGGGQLYLDFVSGATLPSVPGQSGFDWDIAPYGGGQTNQSSYALTTVTIDNASSANLAPGTTIGPASVLLGATGGIQNVSIPNNTTGIIGFKFNPASTDGFNPGANNTPTHYGWFRLEVNTTTGGKIVDWAYENVAGVSIGAGAVPEPSSLGCLALGAAGIRSLRRRRQAQAA